MIMLKEATVDEVEKLLTRFRDVLVFLHDREHVENLIKDIDQARKGYPGEASAS